MDDNTTDTVRVRFTLNIGFVGAEREVTEEFDRAEWEAMDTDARNEFARHATAEYIETDWEEID